MKDTLPISCPRCGGDEFDLVEHRAAVASHPALVYRICQDCDLATGDGRTWYDGSPDAIDVGLASVWEIEQEPD